MLRIQEAMTQGANHGVLVLRPAGPVAYISFCPAERFPGYRAAYGHGTWLRTSGVTCPGLLESLIYRGTIIY